MDDFLDAVTAFPLLPNSPPRLKAGVVLAGPAIPAWQDELIGEVWSRTLEMRLLVYPAVQPARSAAMETFASLVRALGNMLGIADPCRLEAPLAGRYQVFEAKALHGDRPVFEAEATRDLDVILVMPHCAPPSGDQARPRLGYLAFDLDPVRAVLEGVARFRQVVQVALLHIEASGERRPVRSLATAVDVLSPAATLSNVLAKAKLLPARALAQYNALESFAPGGAVHGGPARVLGWGALALWFAGAAYRAVSFVAQGALTREQWFLTLGKAGPGLPESLRGVKPVYPPPSRGFADPFLFERGGETFIFFEDIELNSGKGSIAAARLSPKGGFDEFKTVLSLEHHLSYPFVFEHQGEVYMMPESAQAGRLDVYRASEFPLRWEFFRTVMAGVYLVDGTLFEYDGKFWLFAGGRVPSGSSHDELYLFFGPTPFGPFAPHPMNPVVSDVRRARPAGRIFRDGERIIRPAQDCSGHYGRAVEFREIEVLTETDYAERYAGRMTPAGVGGNSKAHTYERLGGLWAADGLRRIPFRGGG
jgi:hypothetical protein